MNNPVSGINDHYTDAQIRTGFFVEFEECVTCGCCECEAPNNIGSATPNAETQSSSPFDPPSEVHTQPRSPDELKAVLRAAKMCMVECIYYGGDDPKIIERIEEHKQFWDEAERRATCLTKSSEIGLLALVKNRLLVWFGGN